MKTWHFELGVVAAVLAAVVVFSRGGFVEWIGAAAVTLSFAHAQVADRLAEGEHERATLERGAAGQRAVRCYRWAARYLVGKETLWCAFFLLHHAWSALAGVGLFLAYPVWRRWWRARCPIGRSP